MKLCTTCRGLDIQKCRETGGLLGIYYVTTLEHTAKDDCSFCQFLCESLRDEIEDAKKLFRKAACLYLFVTSNGKKVVKDPFAGLRINEMRAQLVPGYWGANVNLLFSAEEGDAIYPQHTYRVLADSNSSASRNHDVIGTYLGNDPTSKTHVLAIQAWLIDCLTNHEDCCVNASGSMQFDARDVPLPTRCLDIKDPQDVKLAETKGQMGAYITLSHRWGTETATSRTVVENYERRKSFLDTNTLPRVFQDVIHLARLLGIQYVWIDSLCIIQHGDNDKDWHHEALLIGQYYQHSLLTIAVAVPTSTSSGCLSARQSTLTGTLTRLPYRDLQGHQAGFIYVHKREGHVHREYATTIRESELLARGWVLQEWLLSRRLIFLTPNQMFFECQSRWPKNEYEETVDLGMDMIQVSDRVQTDWRVPLKPMFTHRTASPEDLWCAIVETYSLLSLTKPKIDRIIAIAGVASEIGQMMTGKAKVSGERLLKSRHEYITGLWLRDIHFGLLWEQAVRWEPRPSGCGAATWSWASIILPIKWQARHPRVINCCEILALTQVDGQTIQLENSNATHADEQDNVLPQAGNSENSMGQNGRFGVTKTFTVLKIRGKMRPLLVGRYLNTKESDRAREYTGQAINFAGLWRAVSIPDIPGKHLGWASIESIAVNCQLRNFQSDRSSSSILMHGLLVDSLKGVGGGIKFGRLGFTHSVCCVLFLEHMGGEVYQRVGIGRIFQSECFENIEEQVLSIQ